MNEHVDYVAKPAHAGTRFLWWCAGADKKILQYSSYADHVKYVGIGGVVLATGFMAALAMGFALDTIFDTWYVTIPVALIWALIVFNLDRFIVSSTGKGDGESSISLKELGNAAPRLFMAILLGLTISAPLETKIFSPEIEREWNDVKDKIAISKQVELKRELELTNTEGNIYQQLKADSILQISKESNFQLAQKNLIDAGCNNPDNCHNSNHLSLIRALDLAKAEKIKVDSNFNLLKQNLAIAEKDSEKKLADKVDSIKNQPAGFLDKILMLENLSSNKKEIDEINPITKKETGKKSEIVGSAFWPIWLVRLLFMIIEVAPVLLKLMLIKSPYDYMGENVNQILEAKQGISLQHMTDEHSQIHKLKENFNPRRIIAIVEHQNAKEEENAKEAISQFAEKEKQEIAKNPEAFIKPDEPTV